MDSVTINSKEDYERALVAARKLEDFQPATGSWQSDALLILRILMAEYEDKNGVPETNPEDGTAN